MAGISVVAVITAKPGSGDEVEAMLRGLAESTHGEDGCALYSLQRGLEDRDVFVTVEKWDSQEALQAHMGGPAVAAALATGARCSPARLRSSRPGCSPSATRPSPPTDRPFR
jgi:quinol monooxygenase YgiN